LAEQAAALCYTVAVPEHQKDKLLIPKRIARVALSYRKVTIHPPCRKKDSLIPTQPTTLTVVHVKEIDPPSEVKEPIEWILYTSLPIDSSHDALQVVDYYKSRWLIEIFHFVLKQGTQIEALQLKNTQAIQNAIVTYSMVALQVQNLKYVSVVYPEQALESVEHLHLTAQDYLLLATFLNITYHTKHDADKQNPTVAEFFLLIAQLGGFQIQKGKTPGVKTIWRGWQLWTTLKQFAIVLRI
jgi:hypothetical protein